MAQTLQIMRFDSNDGYYYCIMNDISLPVDTHLLEMDAKYDYNIHGDCDWEVHHYEIGDGESGMDDFIPMIDIERLIDGLDDEVFDKIEHEIEMKFGYDVMEIQSDSGILWIDYDDEDDYEDDIDGEYL